MHCGQNKPWSHGIQTRQPQGITPAKQKYGVGWLKRVSEQADCRFRTEALTLQYDIVRTTRGCMPQIVRRNFIAFTFVEKAWFTGECADSQRYTAHP